MCKERCCLDCQVVEQSSFEHGLAAERDRIIRELNNDAVITTNVPANILEHITFIVEGHPERGI